MSNGLLNASGLTTPKVTTEEIILRGKPISDAINGGGEFRITAPHALGDFYFSITSHMPDGVLPLNGSEVSRVTYSDLYNYVLNIHNELVASGKKFIVSEEEWQNISIENNGYVPYYSYGTTDGMFRLPRMSGYLKATGEVDEAGNYVAEGLPNITGSFNAKSLIDSSTPSCVGALYYPETTDFSYETPNSGSDSSQNGIAFDASRSNSIYGNSEHVTPETNTLFVGVWALTAFTQVGTANLTEIKEILSQCETILGDSLPLLSSRYDARGLETSAWKVSDGSWLDGRIYSDAYNKILQRIAEGDTVCLEMKESELLSSNEFPENFLIDTENVKFRLPLFLVNERVIIKEWRDGTEWYRIYSDGYIEQGGEINGTAAQDVTVNLLVPFINTEYTVLKNCGINGVYAENITGKTVSAWNYTTTSFTARTGSGAGLTKWRWYAFGQGEALDISDWNGRNYFKVSHGVDEGRINIEEKLTEFEETAYTRLDEVVEEVSKDYVVHVDKQVGELYFSFDNYCPDGVIPLDGRLVSRATYADLWQWVQEKGLVKDDALITTNDENTVSIFNEDGTIRYCQWYGSGDGSLTFRMPKINGYLGATGDNSLAGQYIAEGLPNIRGNYDRAPWEMEGWVAPTGAFYASGDARETPNTAAFSSNRGLGFDASRSNSIYGNSEHVTPETNTLFVGVWAITATKAAVFDMRDVEEALKSAESYLMNNVPLMSSRWDRDGLGNLGWVKADGSWVDGRHYTGAYNYCVEKLISGHVNFIDGQVAAISEENFDKFIVDRISKRFRLPISNGQRTWEEVQGLNNPDWVLYFKLAHEFYIPAQAEIQEKLNLIDNLVTKTDINLPTLSSRWDNNFAENIGWVKSEGQWLNGNVYRDAYDLMVSRIGINDKFVAATVGTELTDENADKFLIDTAAVKFRLPLINGERVLVQTIVSPTSFCDIFSDGFCEQRGTLTITSAETTQTFVVPFNSVPFISFHRATDRNGSSYDRELYPRSISSTAFKYGMNTTGISYARWSASGFINGLPSISDYNCGNYLFFKLADEVPSTVVDTQQVIEDLKTECDQFRQTLETLMSQGHFVIETNVSENGNTWYRKYSDGWIEQGGRFSFSSQEGKITLIKEFSNTNYYASAVPEVMGTSPNYNAAVYSKTTTNFGFNSLISRACSGYWYACGY